jgi:hypothetical protein
MNGIFFLKNRVKHDILYLGGFGVYKMRNENRRNI